MILANKLNLSDILDRWISELSEMESGVIDLRNHFDTSVVIDSVRLLVQKLNRLHSQEHIVEMNDLLDISEAKEALITMFSIPSNDTFLQLLRTNVLKAYQIILEQLYSQEEALRIMVSTLQKLKFELTEEYHSRLKQAFLQLRLLHIEI